MTSMGEEFGSTIIPKKRNDPNRNKSIPTLTIAAHPNPSRIGETVRLRSLARGHAVEISRATPVFSQPGRAIGKPLADPFISREPIILRPGSHGGIALDLGSGKIPLTLGIESIDTTTNIAVEDLVSGVAIMLAERVVLLLHGTAEEIVATGADHGMVGYSQKICHLRRDIERVADLETPVLLRGASGTGKELVARAIHNMAQPKMPFVSVNMAAVPTSLAAAELFGVVKGSFTGSLRHQTGYFRAAHEGTLFLDEIGETSAEIQAMLLRALETGEISPVGSQTPIKVKTRLIAATDADLEAKIAADTFKSPLFHRLAGYEIRLPALNERREDIGRLFYHFADQELATIGAGKHLQPRPPDADPWLPAPIMLRFLNFSWPGNIRQLRNAVRQLVIGCRGERQLRLVPTLEELFNPPDFSSLQVQNLENLGDQVPVVRRKPKTITADEITATLKENQWDIKAAAEMLGISRGALYLLIEKTPGLQKASDLDVADIHAELKAFSGDVEAAANNLGVSPRALRRRLNAINRGKG